MRVVTTGPESRLTRKILVALREIPGSWWVKIHGGPFQSGIPDIMGCVRGHLYALEVKSPETGHGVTALQAQTIDKINAAGGTARVVRSVEEALEVVWPE